MPQQLYEQVAADLIRKIRSGLYPPGALLPSRRDLAVDYDCSKAVIDKAMWILRREGLTTTLAGVGVYVVDALPPER